MSWKLRPLPLEGSIALIVSGVFFFVIPACLYGYGLHFRTWEECADLVSGVWMFAYAIWSGIVVSRRNSNGRISREAESASGKNG